MTDYKETRATLIYKIKDQYNEHGWSEFVLYYQDFIYAMIRKCGLKVQDCEDLTQKVLLKVWKALPMFDYNKNRGGFRYWLSKIIRNEINSFFRKSYRDSQQIDQLMSEHTFLAKQFNTPKVQKIIQDEWEDHIVNLAIDNLKKSMTGKAIAVFLMSLDGKDAQTISKETGVSVQTVPVYKARVKDKLLSEVKSLRTILE